MTRQEALAAGAYAYFTGIPCKHGHLCERRTTSRHCFECLKANNARTAKIIMADPIRRDKKNSRIREYCAKHRERLLAYRVIYGALPHVRERERAEYRTIIGNLNSRMSASIRGAIFLRTSRGRWWEKVLGYDVANLKAHIERQFVKGMTWGNRDKWHIDHIIPLTSFVFVSQDDPAFKAAWALTNLRPIWADRNMAKGNKREFLL